MDKILEKTRDLKRNLDELELFKEYKSVKFAVENNEEIYELKKLIVRAKNENRIEEQKVLLEKYNSHPLIINLNELEEEVKTYLKEISDILNEK